MPSSLCQSVGRETLLRCIVESEEGQPAVLCCSKHKISYHLEWLVVRVAVALVAKCHAVVCTLTREGMVEGLSVTNTAIGYVDSSWVLCTSVACEQRLSDVAQLEDNHKQCLLLYWSQQMDSQPRPWVYQLQNGCKMALGNANSAVPADSIGQPFGDLVTVVGSCAISSCLLATKLWVACFNVLVFPVNTPFAI